MIIDFSKGNGLVPVIIQHNLTLQVLMLGYMNQEAYKKTMEDKLVTFFSRSKNRLWTKGEKSGNVLRMIDISVDCDNDTLLIKVIPNGPTCHTGSVSCFMEQTPKGFLYKLQDIVSNRIDTNEGGSYTNNLFRKGINKVAQKVGEEAVELVIEAKDDNLQRFTDEAADLLFHYLILLKTKNIKLEEIEAELEKRSKS